jgi:hypothetical protein
LFFFVVAIFGLSAHSSAQASLPINVDQRVRLTIAGDSTRVGRVISVTAQSVRMADDEHDIAAKNITRVEVSRGHASKAKKYAIRGAIISAAIGALSLGYQHDTVGEDGSSVGEAAALGAFSGGLFGGLIGGAIGATKSADRWEQVWP